MALPPAARIIPPLDFRPGASLRAEHTRPFELPDPDDELRATIQRIVDNEVAHIPMR
jgi:hypothetical protein